MAHGQNIADAGRSTYKIVETSTAVAATFIPGPDDLVLGALLQQAIKRLPSAIKLTAAAGKWVFSRGGQAVTGAGEAEIANLLQREMRRVVADQGFVAKNLLIEKGVYEAHEIKLAGDLAGLGHNVVLRNPVGTRAAGQTFDLLVDGVKWEAKNMSDVKTLTEKVLSGTISTYANNGASQAANIIIDARLQSGMTEAIARRGIARAYGADNLLRRRISAIRVLGPGFDITVPRI